MLQKKYTQKQIQQYIDKIKQLEEKKVKLNQEDADRYNKLKSDVEFLVKQKKDLGRQIDSTTELSGLTVKIQRLFEDELAPIKFKRCMEVLNTSDVCVENLSDIVRKIDSWSCEMKQILSGKYINAMDVERQNKQKKLLCKLGKKYNVLCSTFHSKRKRNFKNLCKARVGLLFNDDVDTPEYILFSHFLFKKIYGDVASYFHLDTYGDISMENYESETSMYSQAKEFVSYWTPNDRYIKDCIESMVKKGITDY